MVHSSSPLQNNPVETIASNTKWNKKIEKFGYHSNTFNNNFPFEFYKSLWGILRIFGKISISVFIPSVHRLLNFKKKGWHVFGALLLWIHQKIDSFIYKGNVWYILLLEIVNSQNQRLHTNRLNFISVHT